LKQSFNGKCVPELEFGNEGKDHGAGLSGGPIYSYTHLLIYCLSLCMFSSIAAPQL
jgi:hypothetical protein